MVIIITTLFLLSFSSYFHHHHDDVRHDNHHFIIITIVSIISMIYIVNINTFLLLIWRWYDFHVFTSMNIIIVLRCAQPIYNLPLIFVPVNNCKRIRVYRSSDCSDLGLTKVNVYWWEFSQRAGHFMNLILNNPGIKGIRPLSSNLAERGASGQIIHHWITPLNTAGHQLRETVLAKLSATNHH